MVRRMLDMWMLKNRSAMGMPALVPVLVVAVLLVALCVNDVSW